MYHYHPVLIALGQGPDTCGQSLSPRPWEEGGLASSFTPAPTNQDKVLTPSSSLLPLPPTHPGHHLVPHQVVSRPLLWGTGTNKLSLKWQLAPDPWALPHLRVSINTLHVKTTSLFMNPSLFFTLSIPCTLKNNPFQSHNSPRTT